MLQFFTATSPIIVDGMCIAQLGGGGNGAVVALDLAGGDQKWCWSEEGPEYASPVLLTVGAGPGSRSGDASADVAKPDDPGKAAVSGPNQERAATLAKQYGAEPARVEQMRTSGMGWGEIDTALALSARHLERRTTTSPPIARRATTARQAVRTVLPTPVSVPVTNSVPCFTAEAEQISTGQAMIIWDPRCNGNFAGLSVIWAAS